MSYDKGQSLGSQCYDVFHLVSAGLTPEEVAAWSEQNHGANLKVCARYIQALRREGLPLLEVIPETIQERCLEGLLRECAEMPEDALQDACQGSTRPFTPQPDTAPLTGMDVLRDRTVVMADVEYNATQLVLESRGALQHSQFIETVSRVSVLARLAQIKAAKSYRGAQVRGQDGTLVTNGGRVLGVTATGPRLTNALSHAYEAAEKIHFDKLHKRSDIGLRALKALAEKQ